MSTRELRNAACDYADRGWFVIPLHPKLKRPYSDTGFAVNGINDASDDIVQVLKWWSAKRDLNIGIVCNPSDMIVLDVDPRHGGDDTLAELEKRWGRLPRTVEAETGGGGWHYLFRHPGCSLVGKVGDGLDLKDHGYIVAPPSTHPSGRRYEWSVDGHPDEVELATLPDEWLANVASTTTRSRVAAIPEGTSPDPLRRIPAATYIHKLTGREPNREGFVQCPLHSGGQERTPSLKPDGHLWACWGCPPLLGARVQGGNVYELAALLWGFPVPLRGADYLEVKTRLKKVLHA